MKIESRRKCPYCGFTYQTEFGRTVFAHLLSDPGAVIAVHTVIFVCPHVECEKTEIYVDAGWFPTMLKGKSDEERQKIRYDLPGSVFKGRLMPAFGGRLDLRVAEVPETIYSDYDEACRLIQASPGASVTMARRCVQKMIRTKFKLKPGKLRNEISTLGSVSPPVQQEVIEALETIRKTGKFRALPEDDVKVISDVTQDDARQIIDIIEILLRDWFVAPGEHSERLVALQLILNKKASETG